ncbi:polysaccharide deacetylase family protein [Spirochaeta dissipatitropha]
MQDHNHKPTSSCRDASTDVPGALHTDEVPQFIAIGFDDNGYSGLAESGYGGALQWVIELFNNNRNPDGSAMRASFFLQTKLAEEGIENPAYVVKAWRLLSLAGHEIACHTHNHPHGVHIDRNLMSRSVALDVEDWIREIKLSLKVLDGLGLPIPSGFRAPYLEYNSHTFEALSSLSFLYDSSIVEDTGDYSSSSHALWPYTLHNGSPGEQWQTEKVFGEKSILGTYPGIWELPVSSLTVPTGDEARKFGVDRDIRSRIASRFPGFNPHDGRITGFDWNIWIEYGLNADEAFAVFAHNLDLRLSGNRAPLIIGAHSDIYSPLYDLHNVSDEQRLGLRSNAPQRRLAIEKFVDYALQFSEVRFSSMETVLSWVQNPVPLQQTAVPL